MKSLGLSRILILAHAISASCIIFETPSEIEKLLSAPDIIEIKGRTYILEAFLSRDFEPPQEPGGSPLRAVIEIVAKDSLPFPTSVDADSIWVIREEREIWREELEVSGENPREGNRMRKYAEGGPKWGPDIFVDVVVRVIDKESDVNYLLRAPHEKIVGSW